MDQNLHNSEVYDFRQYDRIWQRVAPGLEPYPAVSGQENGSAASPQTTTLQQSGTFPEAGTALLSAQSRHESQLPGAEENPCCMGSAAAEMLEVLVGFIEEELADQRHYLVLSRQAPSWARQRLRDIAGEEGGHARRLMAVYYLITGTCYRPATICGRLHLPGWCAALRQRYHEEVCGGLNYARAAEGTTDPCLSRLLNELSVDEYRHANMVLSTLERSLRQ